ncbi:hypothetical protein LTR95_010393 [Oleoguttula sp. CCFEE 5521]
MSSPTTLPLGWLFEILVFIGLLQKFMFDLASAEREQLNVGPMDPDMEEIRNDVLALVRQHKNDDARKPPFRMAEIIVMSAVLSDGYYPECVLREILNANIEKDFRYYRHMNLEQLWDAADPFAGWTYEAGPMRTYLRNVLEPVRDVFRIMELPAELRLQIFEHMLQYHWSGLGFEAEGQRLRVPRPSRSPPDGRTRESWLKVNIGRDFRYFLLTERPSDMLALLLVNKQFFADAMPIFYKTNHFHANSAERLIRLLRGYGERRRKYFSSISFRCHANGEAGKAERAFQLLSNVPGLQYLGIDLAVEKDWLTKGLNMGRHPAPYHTPAWQQRDVNDIPALVRLGQCSTREIYFHSSCPVIEEYLKPRTVQTLPKHEVARKLVEMGKGENAVRKRDRKAKRTRAKENRRRARETGHT